MKTTQIEVVELIDDFNYETDYLEVPATLAALRAHAYVVLARDPSSEYMVTLDQGKALTLWIPENHWLDNKSVPFAGTLAEALALAARRLARIAEVDEDEIEPNIKVDDFPAGPIAGRTRRPRTQPVQG